MKYTVHTNGDGPLTVTALDNGLVMIADRSHPHFNLIVERTEEFEAEGHLFMVPESQKDSFRALFDASKAVASLFEAVTDRVSLKGDVLYFDGQPLDGVLADHVVRAVRQGQPESSYLPFIRFWERVQENQNSHSREHLLRWLMAEEFTITDDGYIVAYKGVNTELTSITAGPGIVNGVRQQGNLSNRPGDVVEIERDYVTFDPHNTCAKGLHVGTWGYASGFGPTVVEVWVDPVDVVSVPSDCGGSKMRVCKYTVKRILNEGYSLAVLKSAPATAPAPFDEDERDEYDDTCPECGDESCEDNECLYCDECGEEDCDGYECLPPCDEECCR